VVKIFVPYLLQLWEEIKNIRELNTFWSWAKSWKRLRILCVRDVREYQFIFKGRRFSIL